MKNLAFAVLLLSLIGCNNPNDDNKGIETFPVLGVSSLKNIVHGVSMKCIEFEEQECISWETVGYVFLSLVNENWEVQQFCNTKALSKTPCSLEWQFDNSESESSFLLLDEPVEFEFDNNLHKAGDFDVSQSWKGTELVLDSFASYSITYVGSSMDDRIFCRDNETCSTTNGSFYGGLGDDITDLELLLASSITVYAGEGNDFVVGCLTCTNYIYGEEGNDDIIGGYLDDFLYGNANNDYIVGLSGDDLLVGGSGSDYLNGMIDDDTLWADDYLTGANGSGTTDELYGDSGNDSLYDLQGSYTIMIGGLGADYLNSSISSGVVQGNRCYYITLFQSWECYSDSSDQYDTVNCGCAQSFCGFSYGSYNQCNNMQSESYCEPCE